MILGVRWYFRRVPYGYSDSEIRGIEGIAVGDSDSDMGN